MTALKKRYPCTIDCHGTDVELRRVTSADESDLLVFANALPVHDLLFLSRDIQEPKVVSAWLKSIDNGDITSVVARRDKQIIGTTAIVTDKHSWSSHVGEIRVLVGENARDIGLGRLLIQESFLIGLDLGLEKLIAQMTIDQDGAIKVFEEMGFRPEALLKDHVKDREAIKHDIIILSHDVERFSAQMQVYGMDEAF